MQRRVSLTRRSGGADHKPNLHNGKGHRDMPSTDFANQIGQREDIEDVVFNLDAPSMPFSSLCQKGPKVGNMLFAQQADKWDDETTDGVHDGTDVGATENAAKNRKKIYGRAMEIRKVPRVTRRAERVAIVAGVPSEFARAKARETQALGHKMETICLGTQDSYDEDAGTANRTRGIGSWLSTSGWTDAPTAPPTEYTLPAASLYTSTLSGFSENDLQGILKSQGNTAKKMMDLKAFLGLDLKVTISNYVRFDDDLAANQNPVRTFQGSVKDASIVTCVEFYKSDMGNVQLFWAPLMPDTKWGYFLNMEAVKIRPHTNPGVQELEDRGGGQTALIDAVFGLAMYDPRAHSAVKAT